MRVELGVSISKPFRTTFLVLAVAVVSAAKSTVVTLAVEATVNSR